MRAVREGARAREPRRAPARDRRRPFAGLLSHTDVVLADPAEWQHGPFSGDLVDGEVWGRGALDMKGEVAASAVALAGLAREGWRGRGDVVFMAVADEEVGDGFGLEWLCEEHPEAVRVRLLRQRGRRRPRRARRPGVVPVLDRREDDVAVRASRPRAERARVDAGHRRQRARQGSGLHRAARALQPGAAADSRDGRLPRRGSRLRARRGRSARGRTGGRPARRRAAGAAARRDRRADDGARIRQAQRHPRALHGRDRLPPAPRPDPSRGRARDPRSARAGRLRARQHRGAQAARALAATARSGMPSSRSSPPRSRGPGSPRCASRASPTRTGSARRSAPSPTGSFRRARWIRSSPRASSIRPTSACRSRISSSACAGCSTPPAPFVG